jgi:hypothetical protein
LKCRYWDGESLTQKTRYGVFTPGVLSTTLREALGMKVAPATADDAKEEGQIEASEEPPYYARMRIFGYPPGYIKCMSMIVYHSALILIILVDTKPPPSGLIVHTDSKENDGQDDIQFNQNAMSVIEQATPKSQQPPTPLITYPGLHFDSQYFAQLGMHHRLYISACASYLTRSCRSREQNYQSQTQRSKFTADAAPSVVHVPCREVNNVVDQAQ